MTKDEKTLELVQRAVAHLKELAPPAGVSGAAAIKEYYAIFSGPADWKAGIRAPQEASAPGGKPNFSFGARGRGRPLAKTHTS